MTTPDDMDRLEQALRKDRCPFRIGQGYDVHRFDEERPLILGGVRISEREAFLATPMRTYFFMPLWILFWGPAAFLISVIIFPIPMTGLQELTAPAFLWK